MEPDKQNTIQGDAVIGDIYISNGLFGADTNDPYSFPIICY